MNEGVNYAFRSPDISSGAIINASGHNKVKLRLIRGAFFV